MLSAALNVWAFKMCHCFYHSLDIKKKIILKLIPIIFLFVFIALVWEMIKTMIANQNPPSVKEREHLKW